MVNQFLCNQVDLELETTINNHLFYNNDEIIRKIKNLEKKDSLEKIGAIITNHNKNNPIKSYIFDMNNEKTYFHPNKLNNPEISKFSDKYKRLLIKNDEVIKYRYFNRDKTIYKKYLKEKDLLLISVVDNNHYIDDIAIEDYKIKASSIALSEMEKVVIEEEHKMDDDYRLIKKLLIINNGCKMGIFLLKDGKKLLQKNYLSGKFSLIDSGKSDKILVYLFIDKKKWVIKSTLSADKIYSALNYQNRLISYIALGFIFIFIILSIVLSTYITKPIKKLKNAAKSLSEGELDKRVEIDQKDEIGELSKIFNIMADKIEISFKDIMDKKSKINKQNRELKKLATRDSLTNILNRRALMEQLENAFSMAKRYNRELSLAMVDIDDFKRINDEFGHIAGDNVLKELTKAILGSLREIDIIGRYGGEEFLIIFPETDLNGAFQACSKIKNLIENLEFKNVDIKVTVSIGVTRIDNYSINESINKADELLYMAKSLGKNMVKK